LCRALIIPDDKEWLALVTGAIVELCSAENFEQFGTATPEETAQEFRNMLALYEACQGVSVSIAVFEERQTSGTNGGTFSSGAYRTRALNTEVIDTDGIASVSANQVTLQAGTYKITAWAECYRVDQHNLRLQNITDSTTDILGATSYTGSATFSSGHSHLSGEITIAAQKVFELQHRCVTTQATNGFGQPASFSTEVYSSLTIEKIG